MSIPEQHLRAATRKLWFNRGLGVSFVGVVFLLTLLPYVKDNTFLVSWALCSAMVGMSMNVLVGYAGQISLAHAVLFGTGAFMLGNLVTNNGVPWVVALPAAGIIAALLALVLGFPALRVRGLNLAILTLGFQFVMQRSVLRSSLLTEGAAGVEIEPPHVFGNIVLQEHSLLIAIIATLLVIWTIDRNLTRSRGGRAFLALRQDEQVAASFGIPVARYKLLAFAISGFYAGIAGGLFGTLISDVTNESFDYLFSIEFLVFAVLGGLGSRAGTAVGGAFPVILRQILEFLGSRGPMLGALLLVITLLRYPGGIAEQGREVGHVATLLGRRRKIYLLAFAGVAVGSILTAIAVPLILERSLRFVIGLFTSGWDFTISPLWAIMIGGIALTAAFQLATQRLVKFAMGGATHAPAQVVQDHVITTETLATASRMSFRRAEQTRGFKGPLLDVENLAIRFGGVRALDGVSLQVNTGELIGIMGPNGSGKTTMLNCISGFLKPNDGVVRFRGANVLSLPPHKRAALGIGRTFQNVGLVKQETVFDNFVIAQHLVCTYGPMEGLIRTGGVSFDERRLKHRAHAAIEMLGLRDIVNEPVRALPHGRAKLVELGCSLVSGPELLLLDEPAAGVSPHEADALGEALKAIAANFNVTILMIEHHVPLMLSTCDYIYVLNFGQLLTHGEPMEVARHPDVIAAYLGTAGTEAGLAVAGTH